MSKIKAGDTILFLNDFSDYYTLESSSGWAVTPITKNTKGIIKKIEDDYLIIELSDFLSNRIIKAFNMSINKDYIKLIID